MILWIVIGYLLIGFVIALYLNGLRIRRNKKRKERGLITEKGLVHYYEAFSPLFMILDITLWPVLIVMRIVERLKDNHRYSKIERELLIDVIDNALKSFNNLDRNKSLNDTDNAFYFWDAISRMKAELNLCGVDDKDDWIEP